MNERRKRFVRNEHRLRRATRRLYIGLTLAFLVFALVLVADASAQETVEVIPDATVCERVLRPNTQGVYAGIIVCGLNLVPEPTFEELAPLLACLGDRAPGGFARMSGWRWYDVTELVMYPLPTDQVILGFTNFYRSEVYVRAVFPSGVPFTRQEVRVHEAAHVLTHAMDDDPILPYCTGIPKPDRRRTP